MINGIKLNVECVYLLYNISRRCRCRCRCRCRSWTIPTPLLVNAILTLVIGVVVVAVAVVTAAVAAIAVVSVDVDSSSMVEHLEWFCCFPLCLHVTKMWFMSEAYKWTQHCIQARPMYNAQMGIENFEAFFFFFFSDEAQSTRYIIGRLSWVVAIWDWFFYLDFFFRVAVDYCGNQWLNVNQFPH